MPRADRTGSGDAAALGAIPRGTASRMVRLAGRHAALLLLFFVVVVLEAAAGIVNPLLYREVVNSAISTGDETRVIHLALLIAVIGVVDAALGLLKGFTAATIGARVLISLQVALFEHIQRMPPAFFTLTRTGALVSRVNSDVTGAQSAFTEFLSNAVGNSVTIVLVFAAMFHLSWSIALTALSVTPLFILASRIWGRRLQQLARHASDLAASLSTFLVERFAVSGAQLAQLFGRPHDELRQFTAIVTGVSQVAVKRTVYGRLFVTGLMLMVTTSGALVYGWGGVHVIRRQLDFGTMVALAAYVSRLYAPAAALSTVHVGVMTALVSFARVFEVLDLKPTVEERRDARDIPPGPATVSFDSVYFQYPTADEVSLPSLRTGVVPDRKASAVVLREISFEAKSGQVVALVGPSGGGKTTIAGLVARLHDVRGGGVSINGVDVRDCKLSALRERVGIVTQEAHFFHDTIRANLLFAKPHARDEEIIEALRAAQILSFTNLLPRGLDTVVGERGFRLSGGEKQRLAIARLLLRAPDIVILDEATAHLDSETEAAIQIALETAFRGRTSIVIAHRLSTILSADQILVIQEGRVVERGTHHELLAKGGTYSDLYRRQFDQAARTMSA